MAEKVKKASTSSKPSNGAITMVAPLKTAPKKKAAPKKVKQMVASHDEIARLAHQFWAERGGNHGQHEDDWYRAEQELMGKAS
jgi:hypothetical protein